MIINVDRTGTSAGLAAALEVTLTGRPSVRSVGVLGCADNQTTPDEVEALLARVVVPVFGGTFPALLHNQEKLDRGFLVMASRRAAESLPEGRTVVALACET